jgi:hypothetical protein
MRELLLGPDESPHVALAFGRAALWFGLAILTVSFLRVPMEAMDSFMHFIDLPFHEAGHVIFSPFGRFMMVLGGSLTQVLVPGLCAAVLLFQTRDPFGASLCVWWVGENLLDLAPYINDARSLQLMLLGGPAAEVEGHDWEAILGSLGWLHLDHTLATLTYRIGAALMLLAMAWAGAVIVSHFLTSSNRESME